HQVYRREKCGVQCDCPHNASKILLPIVDKRKLVLTKCAPVPISAGWKRGDRRILRRRTPRSLALAALLRGPLTEVSANKEHHELPYKRIGGLDCGGRSRN